MSNIAIKVENLSKAYQLGEIGTGTISRDLERMWAKARGKEDPFLRIGETNDRTSKGKSDVVWSLKDINFEIEQGDAVGIIGRNGAGKSTLLKILSRVTAPTSGKISGKGRIASLLEVGTGFHPELTGRENIFLNGAILGMRKREIQRKLDEIVDFAGVERYLDTPVKRYSSGMYVRLAFAVAAHLESEILIVDEVLAVGDAEFQKKCLGKMGEVSKGEGRTVLFVSHNMGSIERLCTRGIFINNGNIVGLGTATDTIAEYLKHNQDNPKNFHRHGNQIIQASEISLKNHLNIETNVFSLGCSASIIIKLFFTESHSGVEIGINIKNVFNELISHITNLDSASMISGNTNEAKIIRIDIASVNFSPGDYKIDLFILKQNEIFDAFIDYLTFTVDNSKNAIRPNGFPKHVKVFTHTAWTV